MLVSLGLGVLCVGFAAVVGGATGFGTALVATPLMLLAGFDVGEVVVWNLALGIVSRVAAAVRLRGSMNPHRVFHLSAGSIPGSLLGLATIVLVPVDLLAPFVGVFVVVCGIVMALPLRGEPWTPSSRTLGVAGALGGYLGTTTSLSGPPPVLVLTRARVEPIPFIADLAGYFIVTNVVGLVLLAVRGVVTLDVLWPELPVLVVATLVGNALGIAIAQRVSVTTFRRAVTGLVIATGVLTIVNAL